MKTVERRKRQYHVYEERKGIIKLPPTRGRGSFSLVTNALLAAKRCTHAYAYAELR
jgi:hypothetical protein